MALQKLRRSPGRKGAAQPPRSRAFFLEMLLNMLIFALCAVVALQVFVEGKVVTDESAALSRLTLDAENLAENFKASDGELDTLAQTMANGVMGDDGALTYYYDTDYELVSAANTADAPYRLVLTPATESDGSLYVVEIAAYSQEETILSFKVSNYQPQGGR